MPGMDGIEVLRLLRKKRPDLPVVMMTGHGTIESAVEAMKIGAHDYLAKPFDLDDVLALAEKAFVFPQGKGAGCPHPVVNRDLVGRDAAVLAKAIGLDIPASTQLLFGETKADHIFVDEEQMMPFIPVVRVPDVDTAIAEAIKAEHGYKHTGVMHSQNIRNLTKMAQEIDTTLFIKNGPCMTGLGLGGEGFLSFSIATPTGEGVTTPMTFTRSRRCVMVENLNLY